LSGPVRENDTVFVEAEGAYAAIRVPGGRFQLSDEPFSHKGKAGNASSTPPGWMVVPDEEFALVILEVMAKSGTGSFAAFKARVKGCDLGMHGEVLHYTTLYGDRLTFDASGRKAPTINGKPVDYSPEKVLESPFLNAGYDRGVVTIRKGKREKVLDFTGKE
jgi:hypothetical protein